SAATDLVRRGPAGGYRLPHAGDHREDLQRDLAGAQATSWNVQFPALLGDPQPRTTVTRCRVRRQYLYRLALAGFRTGCRGWRQDTAGLRSAAVEHRRLHAALCGGPQCSRAVASRAAWRSVRRHSVRDRQGAVWPLRTPLPRLPPDLWRLRHGAAVPSVDLSVLVDRAARRRAGIRPVTTAALAP